jgi:hypothetical protein
VVNISFSVNPWADTLFSLFFILINVFLHSALGVVITRVNESLGSVFARTEADNDEDESGELLPGDHFEEARVVILASDDIVLG